MSKKVDLFKLLTKKPFNFIAIFIILGVILIFVATLTGRVNIAADKINRVEISGGDRSITINENGLVEIRTEDGVTYETLESGRLSALFEYITKKAKDPQKLNADSSGNIITITIVIDGKEVTIYIDADDPEFQQIIDEILGDSEEGELISDYFGDNQDGQNGDQEGEEDGLSDNTPTPTPTYNGPIPTSIASPNLYLPPGVTDPGGDCASWNDQIIGKAVISNTVCFKQ